MTDQCNLNLSTLTVNATIDGTIGWDMRSDSKVATTVAFALFATAATAGAGAHWGAGPSCLRNHANAMATKICAEKSASSRATELTKAKLMAEARFGSRE
ncbi:hypothetical protein DY251_20040 [Mesorhizobium denitrificans]|uniref:Uncharacterized protein n=1 Tax=Mesorhizobium denitrificans TaxID=2294114 RepID=A0A371X3V1_9HYPH|nr:hypothetical protein DY251_20040 [Mesorhizobium denitrificans]